jgi:hypothetical protein
VSSAAAASTPAPPAATFGSPPPPTADAPSSGSPPPTAQAGPTSAPSAAADGGTGAEVPSDPASLDLLARRLYGRFSRRLADELLAERERAQLLTDLT